MSQVASIQTLTLVITTHENGPSVQSVLNFTATTPRENLIKLMNYLNGVNGGAYASIKVVATLPDASQVTFQTGPVV